MAAKKDCIGHDNNKCPSFQIESVEYNPDIGNCDLSNNGMHAEIKFLINGRLPKDSTEEECKLMLFAGKKDRFVQEVEFSKKTNVPDFNPGFIEVDASISPGIKQTPKRFLVRYVGVDDTPIMVHCKFWHGNSVDICEGCCHTVTFTLLLK